MPKPGNFPSRDAYLDASVAELIAKGHAPDAAIAECSALWEGKQAGFLHAEIIKSSDPAYDAAFVMSAAEKDRVGDTIDPEAYRQIEANTGRLIALWQHKADQPIGYWESLKATGSRLTGRIKFASTPLARIAKQLIGDGVPLGASIGFRGAGEPNKHGGIHYKAIELLECSVVSVPAHPRAYQIAKSFGMSLADLGTAGQVPTDTGRALLERAAAAAAHCSRILPKG